MSKEQDESSDVFGLPRIRKLMELLREFDLNEIDLHDAAQRIRIKRGGIPMVSAVSAPGMIPASSAAAPSTAKSEDDKNAVFIKSPMVGSFYSRSKPDQPSYVKVGDVVAPETVVCIVEAMKILNEIEADKSGTVVKIMCENGQAVEYGQPLFAIE